jgi:hypothetical protein
LEPKLTDTGEPDDVWLHFDAKYRLERLSEIVGAEPTESEDETEDGQSGVIGEARADDLLKMHAYRDAIRRSAGAYVLYPGSEQKDFRQYHEVLPGLGAFALRPSPSGTTAGSIPLAQFIRNVIQHVASQLTQHERSRFWEARSFGAKTRVDTSAPAATFLGRPAADTQILLGFVRSVAHLRWIRSRRLYNLRADERRGSVGLKSRELAAEILVLYGDGLERPELWRVGAEPVVMTRARMKELGYPTPGGELYYCLPLEPIVPGEWLDEHFDHRVAMARERGAGRLARGAPVPTTWLELMR